MYRETARERKKETHTCRERVKWGEMFRRARAYFIKLHIPAEHSTAWHEERESRALYTKPLTEHSREEV